ncbi:MAG: hypothetical protein ACP5C3_04440 [Methanomicrobiales archaeon]
MKDVKMKFCPNCGSSNIKWTIPQMWSIWQCNTCGYTGAIVIEDKELAAEIKKNYCKDKDSEYCKIDDLK